MPFDSPMTVSGEAIPLVVAPPGLAVTVKSVMAAPPLFTGGIKLTETRLFPAVTVMSVGGSGTVITLSTLSVRTICPGAPLPPERWVVLADLAPPPPPPGGLVGL